MVKNKWVALLALFASLFALCVIGLGAFTRLVDAGLGCPDWPGCYGHLIVARDVTLNTFKAWAEMIHRYFAGTLSLLTLGLMILIFAKVRTRANIIFSVILFLLILYQIVLGQWTVTFKLLPIVVTQHLIGGYLILSVLWLIYLSNRSTSLVKTHSMRCGSILAAIFALVILFGQIFLGAWTSTNYASLSCLDFPFCNNSEPLQTLFLKDAFQFISPIGVNYEGGVLPDATRQTIQMVHRLGALIFTCYMLFFTLTFIHKLMNNKDLMKVIYCIWGLIFIQISLGIINVVYKLPLVTALSHTIIAVVLLLAMITFIFKLVILRKVS